MHSTAQHITSQRVRPAAECVIRCVCVVTTLNLLRRLAVAGNELVYFVFFIRANGGLPFQRMPLPLGHT